MKKENRETLASSSLILTWAIMLTGSVTWAASPGHHEEGHHGGGHGHEFHEVLLTADTAYLQEQNTWQVSVISDYRMDKAIEHGSEDEWELILEAEYGITDWLQLLLEVPYIKVEEKEDNHADHEDQGPGDVIVGLDFLLHEEEGSDWFNPTVAVGAALSLPTGDAPDDPGHDTVGWEVQIVASNTIDEFSLHFGAGFGKFSDAMPLGEEHEVDIIEYELSAAGAWECATGLELILELIAEFEKEEYDGHESHEDVFEVVPGALWQANEFTEIGLGFPIGLTDDAFDWGILARIDFEF